MTSTPDMPNIPLFDASTIDVIRSRPVVQPAPPDDRPAKAHRSNRLVLWLRLTRDLLTGRVVIREDTITGRGEQ